MGGCLRAYGCCCEISTNHGGARLDNGPLVATESILGGGGEDVGGAVPVGVWWATEGKGVMVHCHELETRVGSEVKRGVYFEEQVQLRGGDAVDQLLRDLQQHRHTRGAWW